MNEAFINEDEAEIIKGRILGEAVQIMFKGAFHGLGINKLAVALDMTEEEIYAQFNNKDEIYLEIQKRGFELLGGLFSQVSAQNISPREKIRRMAVVYVSFGLENSAYYEVMFNRQGPKYADYKDTPMEPAALAEKMAALQVLVNVETAVREVLSETPNAADADIWERVIRGWMLLHGYISLINNRTLQELEAQPTDLLEGILDSLTSI
ncbi:transcriptional regulator, TetR family [Desulfatibacillum alkenivorans DSM 16219]|uniref:Transcriptional regulator, TetR family n=1 Tax=Desulfatibacillum alkenivorans DSM 16219 TaxID=1121393 RepID=A0A1M6UDN0_9BACT|nr:TetR-like C-terminal domain-containing protein [Desulfatibacillum alkenivorans]SHK67277.1 transcriptional regulator, TetR family [Desulfatibacillum alkenivorans DSM 16219]